MDIFNENKNAGEGSPSMFMGDGSGSQPNFSGYRHCTSIFMIGGQDSEDEIAAYDALMNRILRGELRLRLEKESFSSVTGICTTIVKYYELPTSQQDENG